MNILHFRQDRFKKNETQTEATTFDEALPDSGILDSILVTARVRNNTAHYDVVKQHIWDHITKIVLKADGIEAPIDIWGQTCLASYGVEYGRLPPGYIDLMSNNYSTLIFPILFGRRWKDGKFGYDLGKAGENRLQITNDWLSTELYATLNIWYDVDLWFLEDAPAPANYIGMNQISSKTWTGNSQEHTFKVPKKYKVRRIFLGCESFRSSVTGGQSNKAWRNLRYLSYKYKSGGVILRDVDDLYRMDQDNLWGFPDFCETGLNVETRDGYTVDVGLCRPVTVNVTPSYGADVGDLAALCMDQRMERVLTYRHCADGYQGRLVARGYGIMDHYCLHEDMPDDIDGYLDPDTMADVEVKVGNSDSGGSSGIIRFITQVLREN